MHLHKCILNVSIWPVHYIWNLLKPCERFKGGEQTKIEGRHLAKQQWSPFTSIVRRRAAGTISLGTYYWLLHCYYMYIHSPSRIQHGGQHTTVTRTSLLAVILRAAGACRGQRLRHASIYWLPWWSSILQSFAMNDSRRGCFAAGPCVDVHHAPLCCHPGLPLELQSPVVQL